MVEEVEKVLANTFNTSLEGFENKRYVSMRRLISVLKAELALLQKEAKELKPGHPILAQLQEAIAETAFYEAVYSAMIKRAEKQPRVKTDEWLFSGEIVDEAGRPVKGVIVKIYDKENKFTEVLGPTTTDEDGEFMRVYNAKEHADLFAAQPQIFIQVMDAHGRILYKSDEPVMPNSGSVTLASIQLRKR